MNLLLDTHTFLWMSLDDPQLSETAREKLSGIENALYLSSASYWEIAIKISMGKYNLTEPLAEFVQREIVANPSLTQERAIGGILPPFWPKITCKLLILRRRS